MVYQNPSQGDSSSKYVLTSDATSAETLQKFGDALLVMSIFPILLHVKFGVLLTRGGEKMRKEIQEMEEKKKKEEDKKVKKKEEKEEKKSGKKGEKEKKSLEDQLGLPEKQEKKDPKVLEMEAKFRTLYTYEGAMACTPPTLGFLLLLIAGLLNEAEFFNVNDRVVRRGAQDMYRYLSGEPDRDKEVVQGRTLGLEGILLMLESWDAYRVIAWCACNSLMAGVTLMLWLQIQALDPKESIKTIAMPFLGIPSKLKEMFSFLGTARGWFFVILAVFYLRANSTGLDLLMKRAEVLTVIRMSCVLFRCLGTAVVYFATESAGPMTMWATCNGACAMARIASMFIMKHLPFSAFWEGGMFRDVIVKVHAGIEELSEGEGTGLCGITSHSMIFMEMIILILCGLIAAGKRRHFVLLCIMTIPCWLYIIGGQARGYMEVNMSNALVDKLFTYAMCIVAGLEIFLGSYLCMGSLGILVQILFYIHKLDKLRYL
eukprot:gnl/TRDRNA2_/TRDRNA2_188913_c0_seq1.p1 gnl/TRDRNA2_/TRDRNA2_188913_c0~~gnl/TRDRNA2_/TRDRNA2_188913_c0_seq1.p1  ORF type:complete len:487 (-),score=100.24 gnl/TRDRNA2_/TRDRNA2_188913_c0_seq1:62-1522(-)